MEIKPDWVLKKFSQTIYADGEGIVSLETDNISDTHWIELALESLAIKHDCYDYHCEECDTFYFGFEFEISQLQTKCPNFFEDLNDLDNRNHIYKFLKENENE